MKRAQDSNFVDLEARVDDSSEDEDDHNSEDESKSA